MMIAFEKNRLKQSLSSIINPSRTDSSSSNENINLHSADLIQSSPNFIYPNLRTISSGYPPNLTYVFSNTLSSDKNIPLIYLGSEYFLRKPINFERLKYPLSTSENLEPLVDLFLVRPQFQKEIPELNDLTKYLSLPQTLSALLFFDSSSELRTNKFTIKDLLNMSQRENNIIQTNALNDKRYSNLKSQLTDIYSLHKKSA